VKASSNENENNRMKAKINESGEKAMAAKSENGKAGNGVCNGDQRNVSAAFKQCIIIMAAVRRRRKEISYSMKLNVG
jgi:hypothetical protein